MHGPRCLFAAPWGLQDTPTILQASICWPAGCHQKLKVFGVCMARIMLKPNTPQTMLDCICAYVCSCVCEVLFQPHTHQEEKVGSVKYNVAQTPQMESEVIGGSSTNSLSPSPTTHKHIRHTPNTNKSQPTPNRNLYNRKRHKTPVPYDPLIRHAVMPECFF